MGRRGRERGEGKEERGEKRRVGRPLSCRSPHMTWGKDFAAELCCFQLDPSDSCTVCPTP